MAADLGYDVTFVTDATATFPIPHRDAPADRTVDELLADPRTLGDRRRSSPAPSTRWRPVRHHPDRRRAGRRADQIVSRIVFVLTPYLHLLDLAGPAQVFSTAVDFGHEYELTYVAEAPRSRPTRASSSPPR